MKKKLLCLILCLALALTLVLALGSCKKDDGSGDGASSDSNSNSDTNTDTSGSSTNTGSQGGSNTSSQTPSTYKVIFFLELYDAELATQTVTSGQTINEPTNLPNKAGYVFDGWYLGDEKWDFTSPVSKNMTLNGKWTPVPAAIKFDKNGGYGSMSDVSATAESIITMPNVGFANPGYNFLGWSTTPDGAVEYKSGDRFTVGAETEYVFYAVWQTRYYPLQFNANGGEGNINDIMLKSNESTIVPECTYTKKFYKFAGWAMEQDGDIMYKPGDTFTMSIGVNNTLYAIWDIDYPQSQTLNIISNGQTDYVIVYEAGNTKQQALALELVTHIRTVCGVEISYKDNSTPAQDGAHEIVLCNARENTFYTKSKTDEYNDFSIAVCDDDLHIYAPNEYLYDYVLAILKLKVFTSSNTTTLTFTEGNNFRYQSSTYKSMNFAAYLKSVNGNYDRDKLAALFEERTFIAADGTQIPYRIYIPSDYNSEKGNPVVTILHGAGERGNDNISQLTNLVVPLFNQANSPYLNSIVIVPQCPAGQQWVDTPWENGSYSIAEVEESNELKAVYELLEETQSTLVTDTDRYYIMGLSMGGFGTWDMLMRHGDMFAGAVVMCGCADLSQAKNIANIPIHAVHGTADTVTVPYDDALAMAQAIETSGLNNFTFESLEGYGHNVWDYVGNSTTISTWLFEQSINNLN